MTPYASPSPVSPAAHAAWTPVVKGAQGVLVIVQEPNHGLEVVPFCYRHAGIYVSRWAEPDPPGSIADAFREFKHAGLLLWRALAGAILGL
jgi:hypothetical protein